VSREIEIVQDWWDLTVQREIAALLSLAFSFSLF